MAEIHDVVVIGTGVTGLTCAREALENGVSVLTIESLLYGGLVTNINELDGDIRGSGVDLAAALMLKIGELGGENVSATAQSMHVDGDFHVVTSDVGMHRTRVVIVASGARLKRLGVAGELELTDKGVSQCASCDGPFYDGRDIVVVGGGDSALQEALVLSGFAKQVHLLHRGERFSAQQHLVDLISGRPNIVVHWRTRVDSVLGTDSVQAVRVQRLHGGPMDDIACAGLFAYVGLEPVCEFVPAGIMRDAKGCLLTDGDFRTAMPGILAAGAVRSGYGGLLTHAVAEGTAAARSGCALIRT